MKVFLPWRLEFGTMLMYWVRYVNLHIKTGPPEHSVVCCRRGDEILFPLADQYYYDWEDLPDAKKRWRTAKEDGYHLYLQSLADTMRGRFPDCEFVYPPRKFPKDLSAGSFVPVQRGAPPRGISGAVVMAPRYREHGGHRNWPYWGRLALDVQAKTGRRVFVVGIKSSSVDLACVPEEFKAWNYTDNLSTTLWAMRMSPLTVTTDSAMAHLAVLAGAPLKVIYDEPGREAGHPKWPWAFDHMKRHAIAHCEPVLFGWKSPDTVLSAIEAHLSEEH